MLLVSVPVSLFTVPIVLDVTLFLIQWFSVEELEKSAISIIKSAKKNRVKRKEYRISLIA